MTVTVPGPLAIALVKQFESCRLHAYQDQRGIWTCGWGSTGSDIGPDTVWTQAEADARFEADAKRFAAYIVPLIGNAPTTPGQFGALWSFAYNAGPGSLGKSDILRLHKAGDFAGAAAAWLTANTLNGNPGLVRRRKAESEFYRRYSP